MKKIIKKLMKLSFWPWKVYFLHFFICMRCRKKSLLAALQDKNYNAAVHNDRSISQKFPLSN